MNIIYLRWHNSYKQIYPCITQSCWLIIYVIKVETHGPKGRKIKSFNIWPMSYLYACRNVQKISVYEAVLCRSSVVQESGVHVHSVNVLSCSLRDPYEQEGGREWKWEREYEGGRDGEQTERERERRGKSAACSHPTFYSRVNPIVWRVLLWSRCGIVWGWC